jgi:hypothetical protein
VPDRAVQLVALHDRGAGERADEVEVVLHLQPADLDVEERQLLLDGKRLPVFVFIPHPYEYRVRGAPIQKAVL